MPWVHRGILAILTRQCAFLDLYPDVDKIIKNFIWYFPDDIDKVRPQYIFSRLPSGELQMEVGKYTLIMMPRGFSKTTLTNAATLYNVAYQIRKFPFFISKTAKHATKQLLSLTRQFTNNHRFISVFGELKPGQRNDSGLKWSESDGFVQTSTGVSIAASGTGGQVRGMLDDGQRPDWLNIDDIEDKENTKTDDRRADTRAWFFGELLPVLPELDPTATATMLCNLVHQDSIGVRLLADPNWTVLKFGPLDIDGAPIWPELMNEEKLELKKQSFALQGELQSFYLEFWNEVRATEDTKFHANYFIVKPCGIIDDAPKAIAIDPAISPSRRADFCSFGVVEMHEKGIIHVRENIMEKGMSPRKQVDTYFQLINDYRFVPGDKYGVEAIAYQAALIHLLREEMFRKGVYFEIIPITHGQQRKEERVEGILQPRYANGYITHQKRFPQLETQLLDWPRGKRDAPDVIAMAISLLGGAAPMAASSDIGEDQFEPLSKVFKGNWRNKRI